MSTLVENHRMLHSETHAATPPAPPLSGAEEKGIRAAAVSALRLKKLLVPVDFSSGSLHTLYYAAALAGRFGGAVSLLHVVEPGWFMSSLRDVPDVLDEEEAAHRAEERLSRCMKHGIAPSVQGKPLVRHGKLVLQVVETARSTGTDLIVLSRAHRRGLERFLVRGRLKRIVRQAPCPTLTVPGTFLARHPQGTAGAGVAPDRRILVPVDGSELSRLALKWGAALAEPTQGSLSVFYVPSLYETPSGTGGGPDPQFRALTAEALEQRLWAWAKETVPPALRVNALGEAGMSAAEVLAAIAARERSDLIVLCSRSVSFRQRLMDGCIAEQLAWVAPCPVLCLPDSNLGQFETASDASSRPGLNPAQPETTREDCLHNRAVAMPTSVNPDNLTPKP